MEEINGLLLALLFLAILVIGAGGLMCIGALVFKFFEKLVQWMSKDTERSEGNVE